MIEYFHRPVLDRERKPGAMELDIESRQRETHVFEPKPSDNDVMDGASDTFPCIDFSMTRRKSMESKRSSRDVE